MSFHEAGGLTINKSGFTLFEETKARLSLWARMLKNQNNMKMKRLIILISSAALMAGCHSASDNSGSTGNMGGTQYGTNSNNKPNGSMLNAPKHNTALAQAGGDAGSAGGSSGSANGAGGTGSGTAAPGGTGSAGGTGSGTSSSSGAGTSTNDINSSTNSGIGSSTNNSAGSSTSTNSGGLGTNSLGGTNSGAGSSTSPNSGTSTNGATPPP
jgi:hypothetical protein